MKKKILIPTLLSFLSSIVHAGESCTISDLRSEFLRVEPIESTKDARFFFWKWEEAVTNYIIEGFDVSDELIQKFVSNCDNEKITVNSIKDLLAQTKDMFLKVEYQAGGCAKIGKPDFETEHGCIEGLSVNDVIEYDIEKFIFEIVEDENPSIAPIPETQNLDYNLYNLENERTLIKSDVFGKMKL